MVDEWSERPICDECGGLEFEIVRTDPKKEPIKASEYFRNKGDSWSSDATYRIGSRNYKAICRNCRKVYPFTEGTAISSPRVF